jgi:hypothetical protein
LLSQRWNIKRQRAFHAWIEAQPNKSLTACANTIIQNRERRRGSMSYYMAKILPISFDEAVTRAIEALKHEGFGILAQIDVRETL